MGASCPARALYLLDTAYDDPQAFEPWLSASRDRVLAAATRPTPAGPGS
jgi:hypothetical protein